MLYRNLLLGDAHMEKTVRQIRKEREQRIMDAIHLKPTDRIPVSCSIGYFAAKYAGIPCSAAYYDFNAWYNAYQKTLKDFQPDMLFPEGYKSGRALEILEPKQMRWPGHGVDPYEGHQSIEIDNMKSDEYDQYLKDPSDYLLRVHAPRVSEKLEGLAHLPKLSEIGFGAMGAQMLALAFADPQLSKAVHTLEKAGRQMKRDQVKMAKFSKLIFNMGFPEMFSGAAMPPFDVVSHSVRGMSGTMIDMYRQPDKIIAMCDYLLKQTIARPLPPPTENGHIRIFMTNTRGSDDFMSTQQFDKFYWPTFKKLVLSLIKRGGTPCIFFEGNFTSRLEYLLDFPKGSLLARFDTTDIHRAKDVLKGQICIEGNVPSTLLQVGSVQDVKNYCKNLIDTVGKGGGYILSPRSSTEKANPSNLKAMIEFTKEYGRY
jgi:uroporphyrinogen-III decarboxylase